MADQAQVCMVSGEALGRYAFGGGHPFGTARLTAFRQEADLQGLSGRVHVVEPVCAPEAIIRRFHTQSYIDRVKTQSTTGLGYLDHGDTPAFPGVYEAAATVIGSGLAVLDRIMDGRCGRGFVPIAGLHHARRDAAAGFCVFNDCGVLIETLRAVYGVQRIAYVDIDAHHGDGVYLAFETDPDVRIVDFHEDGRYLYPGTGHVGDTGRGVAAGTKMNIPMPPQADDTLFRSLWPAAERFIESAGPEFILLQCGADSIGGDPLTHLAYTPATHAYVAGRLCALAGRYCHGRLLALGGGGYNHDNLAQAWCAVLRVLVEAP